MRLLKLTVLFLSCFMASVSGLAQIKQMPTIQTVKEGPIHEAYITQEFGQIILEFVPNQPPTKITELIPYQSQLDLKWIPGYWAWSRKLGDFLWVSGVWRRSPPDHIWINGYWTQYPEGWVWIKGFWSQKKQDQLDDIPEPPPVSIDEKIPQPPTPDATYFWVPGYWEFDHKNKEYIWYAGQWEQLDKKWVFVPSQYLWRESGYVFIPGYWDWDLEQRGTVFASVYISPEERRMTTYEPKDTLEPLYILEALFPFWPNYCLLYHYHYHFHQHEWMSWGAAPPWWNWSAWWCFPWPELWWLWWWWTHPGYPNPPWMDSDIAKRIAPPPQFVLDMMKSVTPPVNVTSNGVVGTDNLLNQMKIVTGKILPILSSDPKQVEQIQDIADPNPPKPPYLRPEGKSSVKQRPEKPFFGPEEIRFKISDKKASVPPRPNSEVPTSQEKSVSLQKPSLPNYKTKGYSYRTRSVNGATQRPHYTPPVQGYQKDETPRTPMHLQLQNEILGKPRPKREYKGYNPY